MGRGIQTICSRYIQEGGQASKQPGKADARSRAACLAPAACRHFIVFVARVPNGERRQTKPPSPIEKLPIRTGAARFGGKRRRNRLQLPLCAVSAVQRGC
jgi:hypothetical protein